MAPLHSGSSSNHQTVRLKQYHLGAVAIVLATLIFYLLTIRPGHNWGDDFSQYIIHARNMVEGEPYKATGHILNKIYSIAPETYPPVFPLLLTPVYYYVGLNFDLLKVVGILCFAGFLFLYYLVFRKRIHPAMVIFSMVFMALNPYFWDFKDSILSEFPFMFFIFLSLYLMLENKDPGRPFWQSALYYAGIGVAIYLVTGTRTIGIVLLPCFLLAELLRKDKPRHWYLLLAVTIAVTGGLLWAQKLYLNSQGEGYLFQLQRYFYWPDIKKNLGLYVDDFQLFWAGNEESNLGSVLFFIAALGALAGFLLRLLKQITIIEILIAGYLAGVFLWPMYQAMRFLMPVVPFFLFYLLYFLQHNPVKNLKKPVMVIFLTILSVLLLSYIGFHRNYDYSNDIGYIERPESEEFFTFVRYTPENARIVFEKPGR